MINPASLLNLCLFVTFLSCSAHAFKDKNAYIGTGYYSQNAFYKTTAKTNGAAQLTGTSSYPLLFKYDFGLSGDAFISPAFYYSLLPRSTAGDSAKVTMMHLGLPYGKNFAGVFDWGVGPGISIYEIKGSGGTKVLNNGTSTATFAVPGGTSTIKTVTLDTEIGWNQKNLRAAFAIIFEGFTSGTKRTESFFLNLSYGFGVN